MKKSEQMTIILVKRRNKMLNEMKSAFGGTNKMKSVFSWRKKLIPVLVLLALCTVSVLSQNDSLNKNYNDSNYYAKMRDSLMKVYSQQNKEYEKMVKKQNDNKRGLGSSLFGVNLDVIFGVGFASTEFDVNSDTSGLARTTAKTGPMLGVNVNVNLIGFAFSTGFTYSSKGFKTANSENQSADYINIPLMFAFNIDVGKVGIDLAAGPYIGILVSHDTSQYYTMKNIDLGIVGTLQGSYFFNRFMGTVLGFKYERGGLNNLLEPSGTGNNISAIKTQNWFIYTGLKFVL